MKKTALVLGGILLALLFMEGLLRLTDWGAVRPQLQFDVNTQSMLESGSFVIDRRLFWRQGDGPRPPQDGQFRIVHPADPAPRRDNRLRIVCLGDSCTRLSGQGAPYSALLEQELDPRQVEVFNASLPGYSSHQGLAWLEHQLLAFAPDLVVVYFGWNDHWRTTGWTDRQYAARLAAPGPRLWRLLQRPAAIPPLRVPVAEYRENLQRIADLVAARGGRTIFVTAPYHFTAENTARLAAAGYLLPDDHAQHLHEEYLAVVRNLDAQFAAEVVDAAALFDQAAAPRLLLQRDGIHLREAGHAALAALLAQRIVRDPHAAAGEERSPLAILHPIVALELAADGQWAAAAQRYRQALAAAPDAASARLGLAWLLAASPDDELRNGPEALAVLDAGSQTLALQAGPAYLDVHAAALAECGRYAEAAAAMVEAIAQLSTAARQPQSAMAAAFRVRLDLYQQGQPYRMAAIAHPTR